jgi:hypothetical protein
MISLDWKERLKKDTLDFYQRKLPQKDYDIDIVYNAYPERIDNKIPQAVITLVGKTLASKLAKNADQYVEFYDYILKHKGEYGYIMFAYLMAKAVKKNPDFFLPYLKKVLLGFQEQKALNFVIDKSLYPLLKKDALTYLDTLMDWIKEDNELMNNALQKLLVKIIKYDNSYIEPIFRELENNWLYATDSMKKLNIHFLKNVFKINPDFYLQVYQNYQNTRNPVFSEILVGAICCKAKVIDEMLANWSGSGNVKLKKLGQHGQKLIKHKKRINQ